MESALNTRCRGLPRTHDEIDRIGKQGIRLGCAARSLAATFFLHRFGHFPLGKGFDFPVVTDMLGRSHLYNGIELDIAQNIVDLIDIGITAVMVDTTLMDKKGASEAVNRAVRARDLALSERKAISKRSNTTTGHLFRGVS